MLQFDPAALTSCYPLMISAVVPRPVAFVSSLSAEGVGNLAPFSCEYTALSVSVLFRLYLLPSHGLSLCFCPPRHTPNLNPEEP